LVFGLIDLSVVIDQDRRFYDHYLLETGWGLLFTVLIAVPLVALAVRPRSWLLLAQLVWTAAAIALAALVTPAFDQLIPAAGLAASAAVLAWLTGQRPWPQRQRLRGVNPWIAAMVAGAVLAGIVYAAQMVQAARAGRLDDETWGLAHLPMQAAFGLALPASAALSMLGAVVHASAWRVLTIVTALAAGWLGAVSVAYPDHLGSLGTLLGTAAVVWGALFAVLVLGQANSPHCEAH
jgi:hypothetical protein